MLYSITNDQINDLANRYMKRGGFVYVISGCLNDNYIITADGYKTHIIREYYLNDWNSCNVVRKYNKLPKKYADVIELLEAGDDEKAAKKFFS